MPELIWRSESAERKLICGFPCSFQVFSFIGQIKKTPQGSYTEDQSTIIETTIMWLTSLILIFRSKHSFTRNTFSLIELVLTLIPGLLCTVPTVLPVIRLWLFVFGVHSMGPLFITDLTMVVLLLRVSCFVCNNFCHTAGYKATSS